MLTGDGADYAQLKTVAEGLRQRLLKVPSVVKVNLYGVQDEKIFVEFSHAKLATLGIRPQALFDSLAEAERGGLRRHGRDGGAAHSACASPARSTAPRAVADDAGRGERAHLPPRRHRDGDARLRGSVRLSRAPARQAGARHRRRHGEGRQHPRLRQGRRRGDRRVHGGGAARDRDRADRRSARRRRARRSSSSSAPSSRRSPSCSLVSFLSLGWRTGIVVALSVPLVLAITFMAMGIIGIDLHRITLGALIIALGLLVDDAIIAVEMMVVKMEQGWDRVRAAAFAWTSTAFPMLTGTLVTAAGFLPVGFANSAVGEYAGGIFWVVGDRAHRVLVRRRDLHALSRRQAAAGQPLQARPGRPARDLRDPPLSRAPPRRGVLRAPARLDRARDDRHLRRVRRRLRARAAAVLPARRSARSCSSSCACRRAPPSA